MHPMNTNKQKADRLTRDLLKDCYEIPPKGMDLRIMELIKKEAPVIRKKDVKECSSIGGIISLGVGYVILVISLITILLINKDDLGSMYTQLKDAFPYILSLVAIASSFIFYFCMDKVLTFSR